KKKDVLMSYLAYPQGKRQWYRTLYACLAALMLAITFLHVGTAHAEEEYLDPEIAFAMSAAMVTPTEINVHFKVAPAYYMYRERFEFSLTPDATPSLLGTPVLPEG